jgi:actin related protein 2/3 complex subunit 1A/1B
MASGHYSLIFLITLLFIKLIQMISAMRKFQNMDKRAIVENSTGDTLLDTIHQNTISEIRIYNGSKAGAEKISSIGVDGQMVVWDLKVLFLLTFH